MIQTAATQLSLTRPTSVIGNQDPQVQELLSFANESGQDMAVSFPWQKLRREQTFLSTATYAQTNYEPAAYNEYNGMIATSLFDRTMQRPIQGPITPTQWQARLAYVIVGTIDYWYTFRDQQMLVTPLMPAGDTLAFEYFSKNWCESSVGVEQSEWTLDTDVGILDERLMRFDLMWRWAAAKGLPTAGVLKAKFDDAFSKMTAKQDPAPTLQIGYRGRMYWYPNVPQTGFGS